MDNDILKMDYETGVRAYLTNDGEKVFNILGEQKHFYELDVFDEGCEAFAKRWHALRAYQDAERKKGVPITFHTTAEEKYWEDLSTANHRHYTAINSKPYISMKRGHFDYIVFTNFRWRAGYPKECASPNCHPAGCDGRACMKGGERG